MRILAGLILLLGCVAAYGQESRATIVGAVTDLTGAAFERCDSLKRVQFGVQNTTPTSSGHGAREVNMVLKLFF